MPDLEHAGEIEREHEEQDRQRRDDPGRLRAGLDAALRAGHGAGASFSLRITGGAAAPLELSCEAGATGPWVDRVLLRAYEEGSWRRTVPVRGPVRPARLWTGRRRTLPGETGVAPPEAGRLVHALASALRTAEEGTALTLGFRPVPLPRRPLLGTVRPPAAAGGAPERPRGPAPLRPRGPGHEPRPAAPALLWTVSVQVEADAAGQRARRESVLGGLRSAWTGLDGVPLDLREVTRPGSASPRSLVSEFEVPSFLPVPETFADAVGSAVPSTSGIPVGRTRTGEVVALPVEPGQGRHFAVVGETGMGKSSLLVAVALRAARVGGLVVLDPMGETTETIRLELESAGRRFLRVAPGMPEVGVNALGGIGATLSTDPIRAERELEDLVHALRRVRAGRYVDAAYWGPRLEEMLARAIRAAATLPCGTLEDAHALLTHAGLGRTVVPPGAQREVAGLTERIRDRPDDAEGARRLLYEVVRNPTLRAMLCARAPGVSVPALVEPGRIVLVSGSASRVGESTARYLLAAYLALVWSALLARPAAGKTFVLLDEAQWFAHEGLGEMLRLARRRDVHVGLATQSLASLAPDLRDAVRTNVADLISFRGAADEALELARTVPAISAEQILALARGEAVVLIGKGETVRWVRTARLPDRPGARDGPRRDEAADLSRITGTTDAPTARSLERSPPETETALPESGDRFSPALGVEAVGRPMPGTSAEPVRLDTAEWRARGLLDERGVRTLGGELGRRGAIVRSERGPEGVVWWVEPAALAEALADRTRRGSVSAASSPQRL